MKKFWKRIFRKARKARKEAKRVVISVLVVLSLAAAMGERPRPPKAEKLDSDYVYLLGAGEPVLRIYSPQRPQRPAAPTIEIITE